MSDGTNILLGGAAAALLLSGAQTRKYVPLTGPGVSGPAPDWPHLAYAQIDALQQLHGYAPGRAPGTSAGELPVPNTFLEDAQRVVDFWYAKVNHYATAWFANVLDVGGLTSTALQTRNPWTNLVRGLWKVQQTIARRFSVKGWEADTPFTIGVTISGSPLFPSVDPTFPGVDLARHGFRELAKRRSRGTPTILSIGETDAFWRTVLSATQDLRVADEFHPTDYQVALQVLGDAAKHMPATLGEWLGKATTAVLATAGEAAGGLLSGFAVGAAPLLILAFIVWRALR